MKHKFSRIRQVAPMCPHGRAHWRHLSNTTELSVCGGDAALCQNTLTTCFSITVSIPIPLIVRVLRNISVHAVAILNGITSSLQILTQ